MPQTAIDSWRHHRLEGSTNSSRYQSRSWRGPWLDSRRPPGVPDTATKPAPFLSGCTQLGSHRAEPRRRLGHMGSAGRGGASRRRLGLAALLQHASADRRRKSPRCDVARRQLRSTHQAESRTNEHSIHPAARSEPVVGMPSFSYRGKAALSNGVSFSR